MSDSLTHVDENYIDDSFTKNKTELIHGKIYAMSPRPRLEHGTVCTNIVSEFRNYLKGKSCRAYGDGVDLFLNDKNRFIPDVMIVCNPDIRKKDGIHGTPDLVVEVLSPSTAQNDRWRKKSAYEQAGVKEYWLVDPLNCIIEVYLNKNNLFILDKLYTLEDDILKVSILNNLIIKLTDIFDYVDEL